MSKLRRNEDGRWEEVVPPQCHNGHPLGVGRMTNSMDEHPVHRVRVRTWTCTAPGCGDVTYADPDPGDIPRGQHGPLKDYR